MGFEGLTYTVITFGCQMNKHDSEHVGGMLEALGALPVDAIKEADIVVYMTCCVREAADERLFGQVASMKNVPLREGSPLAKRIVALGGCIGQRDGEQIFSRLKNVSVVFGTHNLSSLPGLISSVLEDGSHHAEVKESSEAFPTDLPSTRETPWAAWLPITIGCDNFCSYCIVPYVRGREKSRPLDDIVKEAQSLVDDGVVEITLLGQNVNSYGRDLYGRPRFADVLDAVASSGVKRLRFATSHPKDLTDEVIGKFAALPALMPALHLPVQSGSDRILHAMNRRYTSDHYLQLIERLRASRPDIALSTDVIVGFPGETEEDFQATYDLIEKIGFHQVFSFIYSRRAHTPAAEMPDDTPRPVIQNRFDRLVSLVERQAEELNQADVGSLVDVLIEGASKKDKTRLVGKTPKHQTVHAPVPEGTSIENLRGTIEPIRIEKAGPWYLSGSLSSS